MNCIQGFKLDRFADKVKAGHDGKKRRWSASIATPYPLPLTPSRGKTLVPDGGQGSGYPDGDYQGGTSMTVQEWLECSDPRPML